MGMIQEPMINERNAGYVLICYGVGVAKRLPNRKEWKVQSLIGPIWNSVYIEGKKTDVKFVKTKAAARRLLIELYYLKAGKPIKVIKD